MLRFLLERVFTEDRDYPEKEVNQRLALFHPDVAALRRYLVDDGYVDREAGCTAAGPLDPAGSGREPRFDAAALRLGRVVAAHDRLDQPEVAVPAPVQHGDPLVLGIHEHVEVVAEVLHRRDGVLLEHRLDGEALGLHDLALVAGLGGPVGDLAEDRLLLLRTRPDPRLLLVVDRLALDLVDDGVERRLVRARRRRGSGASGRR